MSSDPNQPVERQARKHVPALIAIVVALLVAAVAVLVFGGTEPEEVSDEPTANTTTEPAEGEAEGVAAE